MSPCLRKVRSHFCGHAGHLCWLCALGVFPGCDSPATPSASTTAKLQFSTPSSVTFTAHPVVAEDPRDPHPVLGAMLHLDVYVIDLPLGSVSNSPLFWKHVDEQSVGVAASLNANRNGLRCGTIPRSESAYYSRFFDEIPHYANKITVDQMHADSVKLDIDKSFDHEDLFFFGAQNQLEGRSYDSGINEMTLGYGPAPRHPGAARLVFCPQVQSEKKHLDFTAINSEIETRLTAIDRLHDQAIIADVPDDCFFVLSPSADTDRSSVGGAFLIKTDRTVRTEQVIVAIPTFVQLDGKPITRPDLFVKPETTTKPSQNPVP